MKRRFSKNTVKAKRKRKLKNEQRKKVKRKAMLAQRDRLHGSKFSKTTIKTIIDLATMHHISNIKV